VITEVPSEEPLTRPVAEPTGATTVLLLLHVPPAVALPSSEVLPRHMLVIPVIGGGVAFTVKVAVV